MTETAGLSKDFAPPRGFQDPLTFPDRRDAAAIALLAGGLVAMFWKVLFTPAMFFYRDIFNYSYPHARFIHEILRQGALPYWNPYLNYGEPVLANPNFLFFYPSTLFLILFPVDFAYTMHFVGHFAVGAIGTYCLARRWEQSRGGALFAAFVFAFSGPVLSLGNFYNHAACAAWIPWALYLTDRAAQTSNLRPWICLTLVFSLQFLAAEPFTLLATFGLSVALGLVRTEAFRNPFSTSTRRLLGRFLVVGTLMVALCAVQFFPSIDLLEHSRRGTQGLPYKETSTWPFHPFSLLEVVLQDFFGSPFNAPSLWTLVLNGRNVPYFPSVFVGFVPLLFALAGWTQGRHSLRRFAAGGAVTFLLLSFARLTPAFALAYLLVPPLQLVRFPVKLLVPAMLLTSLLAGWGLDALRHRDANLQPKRVLRSLEALLAGTTSVWLVSMFSPRWLAPPVAWVLRYTNDLFLPETGGTLSAAQIAEATNYLVTMVSYYLPALAAFGVGGLIWTASPERGKAAATRAVPVVALLGLAQMFWVNSNVNPTVPKSFYDFRPPVLSRVPESDMPYRFCAMYRGPLSAERADDARNFLNFDSIPEARDFSPLAQLLFRSKLLLERGSMLSEVETSLNVDIERSLPPFLYEFWVFALRQTPDPARTDCLIGRTNVKYMILPAGLGNANAHEIAPVFNGTAEPDFLYENGCASPRTYVAERALRSPDSLETLELLSRPDFDVSNTVILDGRPRAASPSETPGKAGTVRIVERKPNAVTLRARLFRPGYVVLLDRYDPNWHASVDDREEEVLRANQMFRAVRVGAGEHEVRFFYRPRGLKAGAVVSLLTLGVLGLLWFMTLRPSQRANT